MTASAGVAAGGRATLAVRPARWIWREKCAMAFEDARIPFQAFYFGFEESAEKFRRGVLISRMRLRARYTGARQHVPMMQQRRCLCRRERSCRERERAAERGGPATARAGAAARLVERMQATAATWAARASRRRNILHGAGPRCRGVRYYPSGRESGTRMRAGLLTTSTSVDLPLSLPQSPSLSLYLTPAGLVPISSSA